MKGADSMHIVRTAKPIREMAEVKLWPCGGCNSVHMAVRGMVLNFSREEFSTFTEAVVDIYYGASPLADPDHSIVDLLADEIGDPSTAPNIH
ncbi:MAG: hypothetical protein IPM59_13320 [Chloracidobacterium sp.]|nr:hypothetical protein [Chloracidobacterium sp.]